MEPFRIVVDKFVYDNRERDFDKEYKTLDYEKIEKNL